MLRAQPNPITEWKLTTALEKALATRPELEANHARLAELEAKVSKAWGGLFPTLDFKLTAGTYKDAANGANPVFGGENYNLYQAELAARQPIFAGGVLWGEIQRLAAERRVLELERETLSRDTQLKVIRDFYAVLLADTKLKTYTAQEKVLEDLLKIVRARYRIGNERELAVLQIETELALLRPKIALARRDLAEVALDLTQLMGLSSPPEQLRLRGTLAAPDWESLAGRLRSVEGYTKSEIRQVEARIEATEAGKLTLMATHWPSLALFASAGREGTLKSRLLERDSDRWAMGLQLTVPLFSGLTSIFDRRAAAEQIAALRADLRGVREQSATDLHKAERGLAETRTAVAGSAEAFRLAERSLPIAKRTYQLGVSNYRELSDTQKNFLEAQLQLEQSRHDYLKAMVDYFAAAGWPLEELVSGMSALPSEG
jgi:outer membrane protein TolC